MGGFTDPPSTGGGGYDYVQDAEPGDAVEGEEWYDTGDNAAFVYDGAGWIEETVTDHGQLSGVSPDDHHTQTTSSDIDHSQVQNVQGDQHHTRPTVTSESGGNKIWAQTAWYRTGPSELFDGDTSTQARDPSGRFIPFGFITGIKVYVGPKDHGAAKIVFDSVTTGNRVATFDNIRDGEWGSVSFTPLMGGVRFHCPEDYWIDVGEIEIEVTRFIEHDHNI
jgi:hypothetical protein